MPDYFDTGFCVHDTSWRQQQTLLERAAENWDDAPHHCRLMLGTTASPVAPER